MEVRNESHLIGKEFNDLIILQFVTSIRDKTTKTGKLGSLRKMVECRCKCGVIRIFQLKQLKSNKTKSCGCRKKMGFNKTHGMRNTKEYSIWAGIKSRCFNQNDTAFKYYGGRGITMCESWKVDFLNFYKDMGAIPSEDHSVDRVDNDKNYCKKNCKWATRKEQANNKRNCKLITYKEKTLTITQWSELLGFPNDVLYQRLYRLKWGVEKAMTLPYNYRITKL